MSWALAVCWLAFVSGCTMGPNYQRPAVNPPENFRFATGETANSIADLPWWEVFKDPQLQDLIRTAVANNYDLKQAVARVEQARNLAVVARAPLFPQVGYGGDIGRGSNAQFNQIATLNDATQSSAQINVNVAWEIDIWGRIRRLSEAARAQYLATDEARRGVTITLVSDVATAYFQLLDLDEELRIQRAAVEAYAGSYRIFNDRKINGVASKLETDRAAAAQATAAAAVPQLELNIATTENQLNVLLGRSLGPIQRSSLAGQPQLVPEIPAGLPSSLLQRRPDVVATEQLLIAANANIGANLANFYPQISLTGFLGELSPTLSGYTSTWNVGASLAGPIFQGGQIRAQYRAAIAKFDEAKAAYEQSVLTAFQEVSNALIARQKLAEVSAFDEQAVVALTSSVDLATQRYLNGKSSYFEVLQAQQELYPTQRAQVQAQVGALTAVVQLYKALGGGWQTSPQVDGDQKTTGAPQITTDKPAPTSASDRIEVVMEGDTSVVNVYHERGIGGAEVRMPKSGWPAAVVVRLHGFPDLESFKADAGAASLNCELQRPDGRSPEQVCRMGNTRVDAIKRTPQFYQVTLPKNMLNPEVRTAELHWVDQWR